MSSPQYFTSIDLQQSKHRRKHESSSDNISDSEHSRSRSQEHQKKKKRKSHSSYDASYRKIQASTICSKLYMEFLFIDLQHGKRKPRSESDSSEQSQSQSKRHKKARDVPYSKFLLCVQFEVNMFGVFFLQVELVVIRNIQNHTGKLKSLTKLYF